MPVLFSCSLLCPLAAFQAQADAVGDHGDEFTVGRLAAGIVDSVAKEGIQHINIASVPCNFDGVANRAFNAAGSRIICFCDGRVQLLGNGIDDR